MRHHDGGRHTEPLRRHRHALGVVAARPGHHATGAHIVVKAGKGPESPTELEGTDMLKALTFEKDAPAKPRIKRRIAHQWRPHRVARKSPRGGLHIRELHIRCLGHFRASPA